MSVTPKSLRDVAEYMRRASGVDPTWLREAADEIERLRLAVVRIDAINDNPSHFSKEINDVCDSILRPRQ